MVETGPCAAGDGLARMTAASEVTSSEGGGEGGGGEGEVSTDEVQ